MATSQIPGQIEPISDERRRTNPIWYEWFFFLQRVLFGAWDSGFASTMTAASGGPPLGTVTCRFRRTGRTVEVSYLISISNANGGSGVLYVTLPVGPATRAAVLLGREIAINGKAVTGTISSGTSNCAILYYDNGPPVASGITIVIGGTYEA